MKFVILEQYFNYEDTVGELFDTKQEAEQQLSELLAQKLPDKVYGYRIGEYNLVHEQTIIVE